jgi:tellurite resistance protein
MTMSLTEHQRRWLGTAIAMAQSDGVLKLQERALLDRICASLNLSLEARREVEQMLREPPTPIQLASWALTTRDRVGLYRLALSMARADGETDRLEAALLHCLASVLNLTPEEQAAAREDPTSSS